MISDHRRAQIMGNKQEKRVLQTQLGNDGKQMLAAKRNREAEERKRDMAETRRCQERAAAQNAMFDQQMANKRQ